MRDRDRAIGPSVLRRMAQTIAHRGPDAEGFWSDNGVGLAHRRLSIIGLEGGEQPIGNEDGAVQVVFNGEIYNYRELKRALEGRGHTFRTATDTEVLVHLYEEDGERLVDRLRGMFAFAIWDGRRQRVLLARDRVGLKPLYWYRDHERLLFASEIKALLAHPGVPRELDLKALEEYLTFGVIGGERSIFRHIRKLPAGHTLSVGRDDWHAVPRRYWELNVVPDESRSLDEWTQALDAKIRETVAAHRIADVPVGAFLSGGLDSSAIVATFAEVTGEPVQTFSIGFEDQRFSELPYARQVARQLGTRHVEEVVTAEAAESLEALIYHYDEPFADSSAVPTMQVARVAQRHVKVVLSGDGGDEAFGGYARYAHDLREAAVRRQIPRWLRRSVLRRAAALWPKADWLPRPLRIRTALQNLSLDSADAYANTISICRLDQRRRLLGGDVRRELNGFQPEAQIAAAYGRGHADALRGMIGADAAFLLPDDFLTKVDRASMAVGLEVRPPFVDHELLELAARVPSRWKICDGQTKWMLKRLYEDRLPRDVVYRPKQGFEIPVDDWLRGPLQEQFESRVLGRQARIADVIDQAAVERIYSRHRQRTGRHGAVLWSLLVLGCWMERWLKQDPTETRPDPPGLKLSETHEAM